MSSEADSHSPNYSTAPPNANEVCVGPESDMAGKASSCEGCPNQSACASGEGRQKDPDVAEVADRLQGVSHKLLVLSGKGGVGKSSVSCQLSWYLSDLRCSVGLCDIDVCGPSVPRMMGVEREEVRKSNFGWSPVYAADNLAVMSIAFMLQSRDDAIIWRGPRKNGLIKQFLAEVDWGDLDFLIVDAPPGTSDEHISIAQLLKDAQVDGAIIVTTPQEVSLLDVRKEVNFCKKVGIHIVGVVENMAGFVCPCCGTKSDVFPAITGGAEKMCKDMNVPFLGSIPLDPQLLRSCEEGKSFISGHPKSPAAEPLKAVFQRIVNSSEGMRNTMEEVEKENVANEREQSVGEGSRMRDSTENGVPN